MGIRLSSGSRRPQSPKGLPLHLIRDHKQAEEDQRINDEQHTEISCVATAEMGNRGRHQRDCEAGVREFLHLQWNSRDHERKRTEDLGDRQFNLEVRRESKAVIHAQR